MSEYHPSQAQTFIDAATRLLPLTTITLLWDIIRIETCLQQLTARRQLLQEMLQDPMRITTVAEYRAAIDALPEPPTSRAETFLEVATHLLPPETIAQVWDSIQEGP